MNDRDEDFIEMKELYKPLDPGLINEDKTIILKCIYKYRKGLWRKIEMKSEDTLVDLQNAIQSAFKLDNDHLYSFFMDNIFYSRDYNMEYTDPRMPEGRRTADVPIGMFDLKFSQKFAYIFDFGDEHRFNIEVVGFEKIKKRAKYPRVIESKGRALRQYSGWG
ncbi:MAG: plasmid pRiA4b ORF-3 family protein [Nanoarchaeota archaeon]|nr:plasmid pRiA4b ORF-3 family protein [Nanoarchaeota archaeon]